MERPFTCEEQNCGMTYMTKLDLDRHAAKHAKSKVWPDGAFPNPGTPPVLPLAPVTVEAR